MFTGNENDTKMDTVETSQGGMASIDKGYESSGDETWVKHKGSLLFLC